MARRFEIVPNLRMRRFVSDNGSRHGAEVMLLTRGATECTNVARVPGPSVPILSHLTAQSSEGGWYTMSRPACMAKVPHICDESLALVDSGVGMLRLEGGERALADISSGGWNTAQW